MNIAAAALTATALVELAVFACAYPNQVITMSVRALGRLEALVARNEFISAGGKFVREIEPMPPEFTADDWAASQQLREALDAAAMIKSARFLASIVADDGKTRTFEIDRDLAICLQNFSSLSVTASGK